MATPSHFKNSQTLHIFPMKSPSSSTSSSPPSTLSSMKLKNLIHTLIFSHLCRIARTLSKAKSFLAQIFKEVQLIQFIERLRKNKNKNKLFLGSFRLHYNWCSSHVVLPVSSPVLNGHVYYDATWDSYIGSECDDVVSDSELSGYLQWLENRGHEKSSGDCVNEIDKRADMFIANCHEKFQLEKQESYRRFQEMMARSV